jgi:hypothetical protein
MHLTKKKKKKIQQKNSEHHASTRPNAYLHLMEKSSHL